MNITLDDGRTELWQWDTGRKIVVDDKSVSEVHYSKYSSTQAITREVINGKAEIPNFLLQDTHAVTAYAYSGSIENGYTMAENTFNVVKKPKPANYVETEEDKAILAKLKEEIGDLSELQTEAKDNLVAAINEAAASGGADWAQNDPTANDYVKNRPGGYDVATPEKIISERKLNAEYMDAPVELSEPLVAGQSYRCTFYDDEGQSNTLFDGEVVAETITDPNDVNYGGIILIMTAYGQILQPATYPEKPAAYSGNKFYDHGYFKIVSPANTKTVKIPDKYIINSDFIIAATIIASEDSEMVTLDKTFDQIREAIRDGKRAVMHAFDHNFGSENEFSSFQLLINMPDLIAFSGTAILRGRMDVLTTTIAIDNENEVYFITGSAPIVTPNGTFPQLEMLEAPTRDMQIATKKYVDDKEFILKSTTPNSTKKFKITVDDSGTITTMEV